MHGPRLGCEIDIRHASDGRCYLSHDVAQPADASNDAHAILRRIAAAPGGLVALNLKELGHEAQLLDFLGHYNLWHRMFLFDMELLEAERGRTADRLRRSSDQVAFAAHASNRDEPLDAALRTPGASAVWFDKLDRPWVTRDDVARVHAAGWRAYAVSPDLHGGTLAAARIRWDRFIEWRVDGICTDYTGTGGATGRLTRCRCSRSTR